MSKNKVLIIDDESSIREMLNEILSIENYDVIAAANGQEALEILDYWIPDIILCDIMMPVMDGFQATRHIRKNHKYNHIPIVALSGDTAADDIRNMLNVGMEAHVEKPLKMDALYDILYVYTSGNESQNSQ